MHRLKARQIATARPLEKPFKLTDGAGLYALIHPNGGKYWRYDYRYAGKRKTLALGTYPQTSLADARKGHARARELLENDVDPGESKRHAQVIRKLSSSNTFEAIAREWYASHMTGKSESYRARSLRILEKDLFPQLGFRPLASIKPPELLAVLRKIETRTIDIAHRANQLCGLIFNYAVITGRLEHSPQISLSKALKPRRVKHYAAITRPEELGGLLKAIDAYGGLGVVKTALSLSVLLFQRPGEIRTMRWSEINWDKSRWERASENQKSVRDHIIPLASQAITLLRDLMPLTGQGEFVFPNARNRSCPMSDNGVRTALRKMGFDKEAITPHGFRAMGRTILNEELGYRPELLELQIAHRVTDPLGRAYNRAEFLNERIEMMQTWADYLDRLRLD